ncbi:DUF481 domain-containing protein [Winogradskyella sp. UBA3174]|uniref:DUF481 domain-containing protein n=1 Tax=Winogradskyella sp. UBA3174 TaxID=1947785 RepID=UPI0025DEEA06|nr:DUF481 domain-containing protein [Winogradskyella sp. UBA3174]|tara:strand:+ start:22395 stop:23153 length:759 start_codon:yes stop_codon:yes gene_type:complete
MKKALLYFLIFPTFLSAQINESDSLKVKASLSITGFWQDGNVETLILRGRTDFSIKPWEKWVFKNTNSYVYQEFGKEKADADFLSLNFLYFNPERRFYPQVLGVVSTNFRREIDLRYLVGAGATYQILDKKDNWLKASLTFEYEETDFARGVFNNAEYNGDQSINTFRSTIWLNGRYELFKKKIILTHETYFQPSLQQSDNYRWQGEIGIDLPLWNFLSFKVNYRHTFESIVIENQEREDKFLTFGFTLKSF